MELNITNTASFVKTDNNVVVNKKYIRWIKKINERLEVCCKMEGCLIGFDTHRITKKKSPESYENLNTLFDEKV